MSSERCANSSNVGHDIPRSAPLALATCALLALGLASLARADETAQPLRLRLSEAIRLAQRRHVSVIVANERVQQALARLGQAGSTLLPQLSGSASETRQTKNLEASGITLPGNDPLVGPFNTFDARVKLTQTLFDAGAVQRLRAAKINRAMSLAQLRQAEQDAMALVAALYLDAQRAADALEPAQALLLQEQERLRLIDAQLAVGTGSPLDRAQAEAAVTERIHRWRAAVTQAIERRLDLGAALGFPDDRPIICVHEEAAVSQPAPTAREMLSAVDDRPDLEASRLLVRLRETERGAEWADALPTVAATADYGASGTTPSDFESTYAFGAQASVPIFEGGRRAFRMKEASSRVRESEASLDDAQRQAEAEVLSAIASVHQAQALVQAAEDATAVSSKQLALARHRLRTGLGSDFELTQAQTQMALSRDQQHEAFAAYDLAHVQLAHAMGRVETLGAGGWSP